MGKTTYILSACGYSVESELFTGEELQRMQEEIDKKITEWFDEHTGLYTDKDMQHLRVVYQLMQWERVAKRFSSIRLTKMG